MIYIKTFVRGKENKDENMKIVKKYKFVGEKYLFCSNKR